MIRMQTKTLSGIKYLVGFESILTDSENIPVLPCFSDETVSFLSELSRELVGLNDIRKHQDIMSYAYWINRIINLCEIIYALSDMITVTISHHICPQYAISGLSGAETGQ